jgi:hypothetical protein
MSKASTSSIRITLKASATALIALVLAGAARADTIKEFVVSGTAVNVSLVDFVSCVNGATCPFSGTMMVDVTAGFVTASDITFPGLAALNTCCVQHGSSNNDLWFTDSTDNVAEVLTLEFTTSHTPASLVGFDGGSITGLGLVTTLFANPITLYTNLSGSITPVPEPGSFALLGAGLLPVVGVIRRRYLNR